MSDYVMLGLGLRLSPNTSVYSELSFPNYRFIYACFHSSFLVKLVLPFRVAFFFYFLPFLEVFY